MLVKYLLNVVIHIVTVISMVNICFVIRHVYICFMAWMPFVFITLYFANITEVETQSCLRLKMSHKAKYDKEIKHNLNGFTLFLIDEKNWNS